MGIIIGIDVGGSTTKIVGFKQTRNNIIAPMSVRANDPVASVYGAFGKFTDLNEIGIADISEVMITGVGSSFMSDQLYGIPTEHVTEFRCIGLGGLYLSHLNKAVIVSMGTGTAIVCAEKTHGREAVGYMGGTGVGGGTLIGLSKKILGISDVSHIVKIAESGDISKIDLRVSDITKKDILPGLPSKTTASNFGKLSDIASTGDLALGIINLVFETVGMMSIFAARNSDTKDIVLTGNLTNIPQAGPIFQSLSEMFDMNFSIPNYAQYATVIGAALSHGTLSENGH